MNLATRLANNAPLLLTLTVLIWGGNAVAGKLAVGHISPLLLTAARWGVAALIMVVIARKHLRKDWSIIRAHLPYLCIMGALGYAAFNGMLYTALLYTTALNATILQAGMPMFIFGINFLVFHNKPHWAQYVGYSLTLVGVLLTAFAGDLSAIFDLELNYGDLIMLVAVIVYASYSAALAAKPQMHWMSFLTMLIVFAGIAALLMAVYEATTDGFIWPTTLTGWSVAVYTAVFPSIIAQAFYIRGFEILGGNKASLFLNRLTALYDGMSFIVESRASARAGSDRAGVNEHS